MIWCIKQIDLQLTIFMLLCGLKKPKQAEKINYPCALSS